MTGDHDEFLWHVHSYTNEYIRFADAKAAVVLAWASAFIGALSSAGIHHLITPQRLNLNVATLPATIKGILALAAFLLLVIAFVVAIVAVRPRIRAPRWNPQPKGFIFWDSIQAYSSNAAFWGALSQQQSMTEHLAEHIFVLAKVCQAKYFWVNMAILAAGAGSFFGILVLWIAG